MKAEELMLLNCGVEQVSCESLNCKEIKPVNPKGNQSWIAEAETPILWPPDANNWLSGKDPDGGKYRRQEEMGPTENEMFGWHYWLNGCEFEKVQEWVGDGQGSLACCSPWGRKERGTTEQLNWTAGWLHQFSLRLLVWLLGRPIYPLSSLLLSALFCHPEGDWQLPPLSLRSIQVSASTDSRDRLWLPHCYGFHVPLHPLVLSLMTRPPGNFPYAMSAHPICKPIVPSVPRCRSQSRPCLPTGVLGGFWELTAEGRMLWPRTVTSRVLSLSGFGPLPHIDQSPPKLEASGWHIWLPLPGAPRLETVLGLCVPFSFGLGFPSVLSPGPHNDFQWPREACLLMLQPWIPWDHLRGCEGSLVGMPACGHSWLTLGEGFCGVPTFIMWVGPLVLMVLCLTLGLTWNFSWGCPLSPSSSPPETV